MSRFEEPGTVIPHAGIFEGRSGNWPFYFDSKKREFQSIAAYVGLTYVTSWTIWLIGIFGIQDLTSISDDRFFWFLFAGSFAPSASALMATGYSGGWEAM